MALRLMAGRKLEQPLEGVRPCIDGAVRIVLVNGKYRADLSDTVSEPGLTIGEATTPGLTIDLPLAILNAAYMSGGVSHVDSFDPKPALTRDHGKEIKADHPEIKGRPGYERIYLKRPQWDFAPHGQCGTEVSTLFPHMAGCVDDIALIRSMHTSHSNHYNATLGMHTGSFAFTRPSLGSWVSFGLGTLNRNLPSFVVIAPKQTYAGTQVYGSDFLPGVHQGTLVVPGPEPVANITAHTPSTTNV